MRIPVVLIDPIGSLRLFGKPMVFGFLFSNFRVSNENMGVFNRYQLLNAEKESDDETEGIHIN